LKKLTLLCAVLLPLAVHAEDAAKPTPTMSDMYKKAASSKTTKNLGAQALSKVGMDITPSPAGAKAYIISPKNGDTVTSPFKVQFGLTGMGVAPKGTQIENTGHHHLLIDNPTVDFAAPLPESEQVKHFGGGQTEAMVTLKPGSHTLQLVLGDWKHQPHNPAVASETITITVK
jgi:hypothetical protein